MPGGLVQGRCSGVKLQTSYLYQSIRLQADVDVESNKDTAYSNVCFRLCSTVLMSMANSSVAVGNGDLTGLLTRLFDWIARCGDLTG